MTDAAESEPDRPSGQGVVVAGASAGGVEALIALVRSLPASFPHPVLIVLHVAPSGTSVLPAILARACRLAVTSPADGDRLSAGHVYVAPPDCHLVVEGSCVRLSQAPRENGHRPAIDPTMRTAAQYYDGSAIGIVLTGSRDDGTAGLMAIKAEGGTAIVQEPAEALYDAMPRNAIAHVDVDAVLPVGEMATWILGQRPGGRRREREAAMSTEATADPGDPGSHAATGKGTRFTCPDCGGVLFERHEGALERFECSVGHVFAIESLSSAQAEALEIPLWAAVRALEDRAALLQRMAGRSRATGHERAAASFERQAREALERAGVIRDAIEGGSDDLAEAAGA